MTSLRNLQRQLARCEVLIEKLEQNDQMFRLLVEGVQDHGIYMLDSSGLVMRWNSGAQRITGYRTKDILGQHFSCFYPRENIQAGRPGHVLRSAAASGKYQEDSLQVRKNGSVFWATVRVTALTNSAGTLYGFGVTIRDNSTFRLEEQKFRNLLDTAPDAMVIVNQKGEITLINAQTEKIFGFKREEMLGQPVEVLIPQRSHEIHRRQRGLFFKDPQVRPMGARNELCAVRKDGTEFPVEINLSPIQTQQGTLVTAAIRDVTERKGLEQRLQEKERLATLGTAGAVFAHEVANPLFAIFSALDLLTHLLDSSQFEKSLARETIDGARKEMERLKGLLDTYRSFARPQALNLEPTDLRELVEDVLVLPMRAYKAAGVTVRLQFSKDLPLIQADRQKMKQVIWNLCKNALEAMPTGGVLTFKADKVNDRLVLEIHDTGAGIAKDLKVFQLFTTTKPDGTGLGLAIVERIVAEHQGTIEYVSQPGEDTVFRISLPCARQVNRSAYMAAETDG
jgi:two-component system, LuxR family, sensor kinase FixL